MALAPQATALCVLDTGINRNCAEFFSYSEGLRRVLQDKKVHNLLPGLW
jgi:hypothetical protein